MYSILFLIHMPPPIHGASLMGKYIRESKIINENFNCRFINLSVAKSVGDMGFNLKKLPTYIAQVFRIIFSILFFKPDLIYWTPSAGGGSFFIRDYPLYILSKVHLCKYVFHYHNKGIRQGKIYRKIYKSFLKNNNVILLGEELKKEFEPFVNPNNIYINPNGIPWTRKGNIKSNKNIDTQDFTFLFISNLIIEKGIIVILDACEKVAAKKLKFTFNIVGAETSEMSEDILNNEIKKRNLSNYVKYLGKKYGEEKDRCLEQANVFVFPTFYKNECCPLVLIEAMQFSLPCISTAIGVIPSMIDDGITGYIVKESDSSDLAEKMAYLISNNDVCKKMGEYSLKKFTEHYTLEKFEYNMYEIFNEILKK